MLLRVKTFEGIFEFEQRRSGMSFELGDINEVEDRSKRAHDTRSDVLVAGDDGNEASL